MTASAALTTLPSARVKITLGAGPLPPGFVLVDRPRNPWAQEGAPPLNPALSRAVETAPGFCVQLLAARPGDVNKLKVV